MKKGRSLQRSKPLNPKVALRREKALERGAGLVSKPKPRADVLTKEAQLAFYMAGLEACERDRRRRYICPVCREPFRRSQMQVHHVVAQEKIRQYLSTLRLSRSELAEVRRRRQWDPRNALAVCVGCHERHTTATARIPMRVLPEEVWEFAAEIELEHLIERYYPA